MFKLNFFVKKYCFKDFLKQKKALFILLIIVILPVFLPIFHFVNKVQADQDSLINEIKINYELQNRLLTFQENSLLAINTEHYEPIAIKKIKVIVTGYSSSVWETDETPFITASGKLVEKGIVANNMVPFGTRIRLPELYGNKIFIVEDRMHYNKGYYHVDIWFPSYWEAKNFGAKITYMEILED